MSDNCANCHPVGPWVAVYCAEREVERHVPADLWRRGRVTAAPGARAVGPRASGSLRAQSSRLEGGRSGTDRDGVGIVHVGVAMRRVGNARAPVAEAGRRVGRGLLPSPDEVLRGSELAANGRPFRRVSDDRKAAVEMSRKSGGTIRDGELAAGAEGVGGSARSVAIGTRPGRANEH